MRFDAQLIKEQVSLREIFVEDGHTLKKAGPNYYKCKCPFHAEDTASCIVHDRPENYFKCFGCNAKGSVFDYWMETRHCDFETAIKALSTGAPAVSNTQSTRPVSEVTASPASIREELAPEMPEAVLNAWRDGVKRAVESRAWQERIAEWRGYSIATVQWAIKEGLLAMIPFMGAWREAFLVERPNLSGSAGKGVAIGEGLGGGSEDPAAPQGGYANAPSPAQNTLSGAQLISADTRNPGLMGNHAANARPHGGGFIPVGYHVRLGPNTAGNPGNKASWRYMPTGIGNWPFVMGDVAAARVIFFFEGQWDALALVDLMEWVGEKFPKHVAIVAFRGATSWKRFMQYYTLNEDVVTFVIGDSDTAGAEWLSEEGFVSDLRFHCKRVWCFYPSQLVGAKDFNDITKKKLVTRDALVGWFRDKMKHRVKRARTITFLQFCRSQRSRTDAIGAAAAFITNDKKHRPTGRRPFKVWERYFHKYVPEEIRSSMYAAWREWLRSRTVQKEAA